MNRAEQVSESQGKSGGSSGAGSTSSDSGGQGSSGERSYALGLARGFGAAIIFSIPMLMTMELWWLGFYMDRLRLAIAALLMLPLLVALSHFVGLRPKGGLVVTILDAVTGYGIGLIAAAAVLLLIGVVTIQMAPREIIGKVVLLGLAASFGSMLGQSQLGSQAGQQEQKGKKQGAGWIGEMFFMMAGAIYLSLTVAPTVEMIKVPFNMTPWHALALVVVSILLMHAFVYALEFKGAAPEPKNTPWWSLLIRYTLPGYVIATAVAAYLLWTFGRFENFDLYWMLMYSVALGFPASVGAAAGRLIL
jgi:putative integral membrane protein (TIGR02587 family)